MVQKDTHMPLFTEVLSTIAKTWKCPKYPLREEQIKQLWYMYTREYYKSIKKNEIMAFAARWMDLQIVILSESRQKRKVSYEVWNFYSRPLTSRERRG